MKRKIFILVMAHLFLSVGIYAHPQKGVLETGNDLLTAWQAYEEFINNSKGGYESDYDAGLFAGYVKGIADSMLEKGLCDFPEGVTYKQVFLVVGKYLNDNPALLHRHPLNLVQMALAIAFPPK